MQKGFTGHQLKLFAAGLMVLDHIAEMFPYLNIPIWFHMLGRLVLPIFLFMVVEGYIHTRGRKRYALRLLVGFWGMGIVSHLLQITLRMDDVVLMNNIFGTMFLSVVVMYSYDCFREKKWGMAFATIFLPLLTSILILASSMWDVPWLFTLLFTLLPGYLTVEGGVVVICLALAFYVFRSSRAFQMVSLIGVGFLTMGIGQAGFDWMTLFTANIQWMMAFAAIPLWLYNGERGKESKWFFYAFYPGHIYALYLLSYLYRHLFM